MPGLIGRIAISSNLCVLSALAGEGEGTSLCDFIMVPEINTLLSLEKLPTMFFMSKRGYLREKS